MILRQTRKPSPLRLGSHQKNRILLQLADDLERNDQSIEGQRFDQRETENQEDEDSRACSGVPRKGFHGRSCCTTLSKAAEAAGNPDCRACTNGDGPVISRCCGSTACLSIDRRGHKHHDQCQEDERCCFTHVLSFMKLLPVGGCRSALGGGAL